MVDGRVGASSSGSDPPPATPSAGHAPTRRTPTRERRGSSGIQCWSAGPDPRARTERSLGRWRSEALAAVGVARQS
jgi:hypothetical protein